SVDPMYPDDPSIPNMAYTFQQALAEILPLHAPEYLRSFTVPDADVTTRDYMVKAAEGLAPWPDSLNMRRANVPGTSASFGYDLARYLLRRGDVRVKDWATLNANATYYSAARVAAMKNWENKVDLTSTGMTQNIEMREILRLVVMKVMRQNTLDVLVNPTTTIPPTRIGFASQPQINSRPVGRFPTSANLGVPDTTVPAGCNTDPYQPRF